MVTFFNSVFSIPNGLFICLFSYHVNIIIMSPHKLKIIVYMQKVSNVTNLLSSMFNFNLEQLNCFSKNDIML